MEQKDITKIMLENQKKYLEMAKESPTTESFQDFANRILKDQLEQIMKKDPELTPEDFEAVFKKFFD